MAFRLFRGHQGGPTVIIQVKLLSKVQPSFFALIYQYSSFSTSSIPEVLSKYVPFLNTYLSEHAPCSPNFANQYFQYLGRTPYHVPGLQRSEYRYYFHRYYIHQPRQVVLLVPRAYPLLSTLRWYYIIYRPYYIICIPGGNFDTTLFTGAITSFVYRLEFLIPVQQLCCEGRRLVGYIVSHMSQECKHTPNNRKLVYEPAFCTTNRSTT